MDREKVIKGLECAIGIRGRKNCDDCPYDNDFNCIGCDIVMRDALALLKEQEAAYQGAVELLRQKTILFDDAIKRLKEQEAKPVKILFDTPGGGEWIHYGDCPNCGKRLDSQHNSMTCGRCGQVVKWE